MQGTSSMREGGGMRARLKIILLDRVAASWDGGPLPRKTWWLFLWRLLRLFLKDA